MKILYISQFFKPERVAASFRAYENSKIWSENGNNVTVFTAYPNFPTGKLFPGYKIRLLDKEIIDNITILRSKIIIKENSKKIDKIINALSFLFYGIFNICFNKEIKKQEFDVILGTSGTILAPIIAYFYSIIKRKPFVLELRDITYNQILAVYGNKKTIIYRVIKFIELFLCKKAKKIIVVTNGFKDELIKDGISSDKIEVIHNGVDTKHIDICEYYNNKEIVFSYMGNIGESQNLETILDIYKSVDIRNYSKKMFLIGDGANKNKIKTYIELNSIENVIMLDGMEPQKLEEYYALSDFCIVSLKNNINFKNTIPSKIFQIMGRGKAVLFIGPEGEASEIISQVSNDFIFTDKNIDEIKSKLNTKINDSENIKEYLKNIGIDSRKLIMNKYDRRYLANKYFEILELLKTEERGR